MQRRNFIKFLGKSAFIGGVLTPLGLTSCVNSKKIYAANVTFNSLNITEKIDEVVLTEGFQYKILISAGEKITLKESFGEHNDYIAFFPDQNNSEEATLWVNNEYYDTVTLGTRSTEKTKEMVDKERYAVGGSIIKIKKNTLGEWNVVFNDKVNKRITGATKIPFHWDEKIANSNIAEGTLQNCAGGVTPWGTVLTCEENYDYQYGEVTFENGIRTHHKGYAQWDNYYDNPAEHYGWVVEVNIETGDAQKLVALGRCKHESATVHELEDGRVVIYSGDDEANQCIYKYVSKYPKDLKNGNLYVADIENGKWLLLDIEKNEILKRNFKNQSEVLIRLREAAVLLGATPMNRPEDIDIDPISGAIFISLTNNKLKGDFHGSILKIIEESNDKTGTNFYSETFLAGDENLFSSPDNLLFDKKGNLWFATDVSGGSLGSGEYQNFLANGLFVVPRSGKREGEVIQVASAPNDAEFTGLCFDSKENTMFVSVQHPGELSQDIYNLTSHWPLGRNSIPKSSVIAITGPFL